MKRIIYFKHALFALPVMVLSVALGQVLWGQGTVNWLKVFEVCYYQFMGFAVIYFIFGYKVEDGKEEKKDEEAA